MKKVLIFLSIAFLSIACSTPEPLSVAEMAKFETKGYEVLYEGKAVAKYINKEYEYINGVYQFEFSVVQYGAANFELTEKIAKYLVSRHPEAKIEIKLEHDMEFLDRNE